MRSVMEHSFAEVPRAEIPRSTFNRTHGHKTTFDADELVPILVDDVIPGDTFNVNCTHFARLGSPLLHPLMDNLYLETFFFFVPYRLVWDNWEKFCGAQDNPADSIDFTVPVGNTNTAIAVGDVGQYMGLPIGLNPSVTDVSMLPFRAYRLIWNEWFRDQNLQDSESVLTDDGPDTDTESGYGGACLKRGKRHDYFTSCLPWPQKGDAVSLPLGSVAPVFGNAVAGTNITVSDDDQTGLYQWNTTNNTYQTVAGSPPGNLTVDLSGATAATINDLRLAFQTQRLLERDARSGTRYVETILAHFGVTVPDFRVQRPEFLGGGSSPININSVPNTSDTATKEQGELAAFGTVSGTHGFTKSFVEHGVIIGLANVRGDITYSQGLERYWSKSTRYDFYYPVLSQIGEQSVLNKEIFHNAAGTNNDDVFGYQERYAEYRYKPSRVTGLFSVDAPSSLSSWHLSEDFATLPALGATFIESNTATPLDRAISVPSEPQIIADFFFDMQCARPLPLYGVPGNLDHF